MTPSRSTPGDAGAIVLPGSPPISGLVARISDPSRDLPAIAELIATSNIHDAFEYIPTAENLDHEWRLTPGFEPSRDAALVEVDGRLAALAKATWRQRAGKVIHQLEVTVHPEHRRRGIGSALLGWAEGRARASVAEGVGGPPELLHFLGGWAEIAIPGVPEFAAHHGYEPTRYFHVMVRDLTQPIPDVPLPAGLEVRPVHEADPRTIWDADVEAFQDHFEVGVRTEEDFTSFFTDPDADTSLWQVAWDGDEVAGSVMNSIHPNENAVLGISRGWLEHVSVRRPWRGRGLASALIGRSLVLLRDQGLAQAALGVDGENLTGALRVYERLGFAVHRTAATYRKPF
jgi:mycothiol synthase